VKKRKRRQCRRPRHNRAPSGRHEGVKYGVRRLGQDLDGALVPAADSDNYRVGAGQEVTMVDLTRRSKLVRELEQEFVPDYDANSMPSADKRAAYALEHIAFRVSRIEQIPAIESALPKA
jgi:hypothetical protein